MIKNESKFRVLLGNFNAIEQSKIRVITRCQEALVQHERLRFEKELNAHLTELDVEGFKRMKVPAKIVVVEEKMEENQTEERK